MPKVTEETISGDELRRRIDALRPSNYTEAAEWLGLTLSALEKNMAGSRKVGRQTLIILEHLEDKKELADHFTRKFKKHVRSLRNALDGLLP